jgi:hypothetical protein
MLQRGIVVLDVDASQVVDKWLELSPRMTDEPVSGHVRITVAANGTHE